MSKYKLTQQSDTVIRVEDGYTVVIPFAQHNADYAEYLAWLADGNEPEPADPPVIEEDTPTLQEKVEALEVVVGMLLEADDDV